MASLRPASSAFTRALSIRAAAGLPRFRGTGHPIVPRRPTSSSSSAPRALSPSSSSEKMADKIESVFTPESVAPIGPYSQAVKANGLVFLSGMMPATKDGMQVEGSVADKTHQMCRNSQAVLEAAGSGLEKAVKITVYFANLDDFGEMNEVYATYFPHKPARSAIEARRLPAGTSMEMDIIAIQSL